MPEMPALIEFQDSVKELPNGVTDPMPVMATLFIVNYYIMPGLQ